MNLCQTGYQNSFIIIPRICLEIILWQKKISTERREQGKKLFERLQDAGINDVEGVKDLFKDIVSTVLESGLEAELEDELGYGKYDHRNKDTDNSRNGFSEKTTKTHLCPLSPPDWSTQP